MKTIFGLILLVCIGFALAEVDGTSCDVAGLSNLASSACSENCENQADCSNAVSLLVSEAERCGCDSDCQQAMDESRLISARCEAELEDEDDEEDEDESEDLDIDELSKSKKKKKKKNKKSKGKKKGNKKSKKMKKMLKKWRKKVNQCRAIIKARKGSKSACVSCCVKNIVLYAVNQEFDLASVPEDVRRQREQMYEEVMNQNIENKMNELVNAGLVEESTEDSEEDLAELEDDEDFEDDLEEDEDEEDEDDEEDGDDDLEEEDEAEETEDSDELDKKKKKKKKGKKKGKKKKNKKKKKKMMKKRKKNAKKACKKQVGMVFAYDLSSLAEPLTLEQAKQSLAVQSLDFDELEESEEEEDEEEEEEEKDLDLDEIEKKKAKVSKKKARKAARKCCPSRVSLSSFEHQYVKQF